MADDTADIPAMDYEEHDRTFAGFVELTKLGIFAIATTLVGILVIAFTESVFFKFVGFAAIFFAYILAFAEFRLKASGMASFGLLVIMFVVLVVAVA